MLKAGFVAALAILFVPACFAQDAPAAAPNKSTVICLAEIGGPEAKNWKLREPIERDLVNKSSERGLSTKIVLLDAHDEKHGRTEGASKSCEMQVYSTLDRVAKQFQESMNPNPTQRGSANPNQPVQASTLVYELKIVNASGKKLMSDHTDMELMPGYTPADFNRAGQKLVDTVSEKILGAVPKQ